MRPYMSIDLETTGLNRERSEVIEIGAVLDDGVSPLAELKTYTAVIYRAHFDYSEPYAMQMNQAILKTIAEGKDKMAADAYSGLLDFMSYGVDVSAEWDKKHDSKKHARGSKLVLGGKNVAAFDYPILRADISRTSPYLEAFDKMVYYAFIDPGLMYLKDFGRIPQLYEIKKLIGIGEEVEHLALDDAFDVVRVVRHKLGIPF